MKINLKPLAPLFSLALLATPALCQKPDPACRNLKPETTESLETRDSGACKLSFAPACERIPKLGADAIFIAAVTRLETSDRRILLNGHCERTSVQLATVAVKESFSGTLPPTLSIHAGEINGFYFNDRGTFLIFAKRLPDGSYSVGGCEGIPIVGHGDLPALADDLTYLRSRDHLPPTATLSGEISLGVPDSDETSPLPVGFSGQTITITGPTTAELQSDHTGAYRLQNAPPGKYVLHLNTTYPVLPSADQTVDVPPRGCAVRDFVIESEDLYRQMLPKQRKVSANHP